MPDRFDYVKYNNASIVDQEQAKDLCQKLAETINTLSEDPTAASARSRALALTKLEECYMWIGKAIRDEQLASDPDTKLQEERTNS